MERQQNIALTEARLYNKQKENIKNSVNCNELGKVETIDSTTGEIKCSLLNYPSINLVVENSLVMKDNKSLMSLDVKANDIVVISFMDSDFRTNLIRVKNGAEPLEISNISKHEQLFGIITNIVYRPDDE